MGRKYPSKAEKNWERKRQKSQCKPIGRPPKKGTKKYREYIKEKGLKVSFQFLKASIVLPSHAWSDQSISDTTIRLCKPLRVSHCITIGMDFTWEAFVYGHKLDRCQCQPLHAIPPHLDSKSLQHLIHVLDTATVSTGHPDEKYVSMLNSKKGKRVVAKDGSTSVYLDEQGPITLNGQLYHFTVRASKCEILCHGSKCYKCISYRAGLRVMHSRWVTRSPSRHTSTSSTMNYRYLSTPEKAERYKELKSRSNSAEKTVKRLKERIKELMGKSCIEIDQDLHSDLSQIMEDHNDAIVSEFTEGSFQQLFWDQQLQAIRTDKRHVRWHPVIIKWCLHLKMLSSAAYHAMRTSGFLTLPSERTLRDYTHVVRGAVGIQAEVNEQLMKEAKVATMQGYDKFVAVAFDEVKIREDLVYDRHTGQVVGFVNLGDFNSQLNALSEATESCDTFIPATVATHMLVFMVRGLLTNLEYPYAQFTTTTASGVQLFPIVWDVVRNLKGCGLKVIALCCDGASTNRKFFNMHKCGQDDPTYKTINPFSKDKRPLFFISDVPHLVKTTRNCWSHSFAHNNSRQLWINGKHISWQHLTQLYHQSNTASALTLLPKLNSGHLHLNSFSRMRVDLAAQVLSSTVANAFAFFGDETTSETERFVCNCFNARSFTECFKHRKPDLRPYRSAQDSRLKWLKEDFLGYLKEWQQNVDKREGFTKAQKQTMCLSKETLTGLQITILSFVEMAEYIFKQPGAKYLFSERLTQDPLECFFGKQRACGGRSENPSARQFLDNTVSLRVQGSAALDPVRGNCRKRKQMKESTSIDETPLPKRRRGSHTSSADLASKYCKLI